MPSSNLTHSGLGIISAVLILAIMASILTLIASPLLLGFYRRRVAKLMLASAGDTATQERDVGSSDSPSPDSTVGPASSLSADESDFADRLFRRTKAGLRRQAWKFAIAGSLFAAIVGVSAVFALSQTMINYLGAASHPLQFPFMFWTCAWPVVLTLRIVAEGEIIWFALYFLILGALGAAIALTPTEPPFQAGTLALPAWSGASPQHLAAKWCSFNVAPTLLAAVFRHRRVRAVAPLVLSFMTVVSAGVLAIVSAAFLYQDISVAMITLAAETLNLNIYAAFIGYFLLIITIAALVCCVLAWRLVVWMRKSYENKSISDQSLATDALWLMFTSFYAVVLASAGPGWVLSAVFAFLGFKIAVHVGDKISQADREDGDEPRALLVLRVFSLGRRSEVLFDAVTKRWRCVGDVCLIAGTDLALSTVAPHQFLAFVSGKLNRLFVRGEIAYERSLVALDRRRDADGRFRINDFFCHADTWQSVLLRLVKSTDAVMMDLRSFAENNAGCVFEINELINRVPLERLVFIVDETTDKSFLDRILDVSYRDLSIDSPNRGVPLSMLNTVKLPSINNSQLQDLLRKLCTAGAGVRRLAAHA
jgi:hypothetical protein